MRMMGTNSSHNSEEIYDLGESIICYNSEELGQALVYHWDIGIEQLYEKNLTDRIKQYEAEKASIINFLMIRKFPGNRDAGVLATAVALNSHLSGIWWKGVCYADLREIAIKVRESMPNTPKPIEELLESGVLSYYLRQTGHKQEAELVEEIEQTATQNSKVACAQLIFRVLPQAGYRYKNRELQTLEHYMDYLQEQGEHLGEVLYETFTDSYFIVWLQEQGYGVLYADWKEYFYTSNVIRNNRELIGNTLQLLERICDSKKALIRQMLIAYLKMQPEYWVKEHLDDYKMDEALENILRDNFDSIEYFQEYSVTQLLQLRLRLKEYCQELRRDFMNNAVLYQCYLYDGSSSRITSEHVDAYFVLDEDDEYVPIGWLKSQQSSHMDSILAKNSEKLVEDAVVELDELQRQALLWQNEMQQDIQYREKENQIPSKLTGIPGICLGILVAILAAFVLQMDADWNLSLLIDILCGVNLLVAAICLYQSVRQRLVRSRFNKMKDSLSKITDYINKVAQIQSELRKMQSTMEQQGNNILYETQLNRPSLNYMTEIKVEHAIWGQQRKHLALKKKKTGIFFWILLLVACVSILLSVIFNWKNVLHAFVPQSTNQSQVDTTPENPVMPSTELVVQYRVNVARANVRTGPGTDYEIYDTYSEGTLLTATGNEESDGQRIWYEVELQNGDLVWICETTVTRETS
jgi:hypothetical protein